MQLKNSAGMSLSRNHDMFSKTLLLAFLCFIIILCFIILFLLSTGALICRMSEVVGRCSKRENTWIHEYMKPLTAGSWFMERDFSLIYYFHLFIYLFLALWAPQSKYHLGCIILKRNQIFLKNVYPNLGNSNV